MGGIKGSNRSHTRITSTNNVKKMLAVGIGFYNPGLPVAIRKPKRGNLISVRAVRAKKAGIERPGTRSRVRSRPDRPREGYSSLSHRPVMKAWKRLHSQSSATTPIYDSANTVPPLRLSTVIVSLGPKRPSLISVLRNRQKIKSIPLVMGKFGAYNKK